MKSKLLLLFFLFSCKLLLPCSCRFEGFSFHFLKNVRCFVGTVINVKKEGYDFISTFRITKEYNGKFDSIVKVHSNVAGSSCGTSFDQGKTYLVEVYPLKKEWQTSRCAFIAKQGTKEFNEDTMLLSLFSKKNVSVDLYFAKGQIKNGKQEGYWIENSSSGTFKHGKKTGIWKNHYGGETEYIRGRFKRATNYESLDSLGIDSVKVIYTLHGKFMYYPDGSLRKKHTRRYMKVYYTDGTLKEKVRVNKHGYVYGYWYKYDSKGKLLTKTYFPNNNEEDYDYYFYRP